ncbi:hypothetical protein KW796_03360 [Candidatus Parcubacteria bacterium]|nr:hypothetical protein [Candidatus Parcubacteria bacterium]
MLESLDLGIRALRDHLGKRKGAVFSVFDSKSPLPERPVLQAVVGYIPPADLDEKYGYSEEKGRRLLSHPEHMTSRESRDEALDQWTGAVRGESLICSISGFPEKVDEALMLAVLVDMQFLSSDDALKIADTNQEDIYRAMFSPQNLRVRGITS